MAAARFPRLESKALPLPSAEAMVLKPDAFVRPVEKKEVADEHIVMLLELYSDESGIRGPEYAFNAEYKRQMEKLTTWLSAFAAECKVTPENMTIIARFPAHIFGLIEANPHLIQGDEIKKMFEKFVYLLQLRGSADQHTQLVLEQVLPFLLVCDTGILGHLDFACQLLTSGNTLDDALCDKRTSIVTDFGFDHIRANRARLAGGGGGAEIHVPIVLRKYAIEQKWGIRSELEKVEERYLTLTLITPEVLEQFKNYFFIRYNFRILSDCMAEKFAELFFSKYRLAHPGKADASHRTDWVPFHAEIVAQTSDVLKMLGFDAEKDFLAGTLFESKDDGLSVRFSPQRCKQLFWQYCQKKNRYVGQENWVEEPGFFSELKLMRAKSSTMADLCWLEDTSPQRNIVDFQTLSEEEQLTYHARSLLKYDVIDRFKLAKPSTTLANTFHTKAHWTLFAKELEKEKNLPTHKNFLKNILREHPVYFAYLLESLTIDTASKMLDMLGVDFYWLHPRHELHRQIKEVAASIKEEKIDKWLLADHFAKSRAYMDVFQLLHGLDLDVFPIPYSKLLELSATADPTSRANQYIFKLYLQAYFPEDFEKLLFIEEKHNYAQKFAEFHRDKYGKSAAFVAPLLSGNKTDKEPIQPYLLPLLLREVCFPQQHGLLRRLYLEEKILTREEALQLAIVFNQLEDAQRLLAVRNVDVNALMTCKYLSPDVSTSALFVAVYFRRIEMVRLLLSRGASTRMTNSVGQTLLEIAIRSGDYDCLKLLLANGAIVNPIEDCRLPLLIASSVGNIDNIRLLVSNGADLNATGKSGHTPLIAAIVSWQFEAAHFLLALGAKAAAKALYELVSSGEAFARGSELESEKLVGDLINRGADVTQEFYGKTLYEHARSRGMQKLLLAAEIKMELKKLEEADQGAKGGALLGAFFSHSVEKIAVARILLAHIEVPREESLTETEERILSTDKKWSDIRKRVFDTVPLSREEKKPAERSGPK